METPAPPGNFVSPSGFTSGPPGPHDPPPEFVLGELSFRETTSEFGGVEVIAGRSLVLGTVSRREDGRFHWRPEIPLGKAISVRAGDREAVLRALSRGWKRWMDFFLRGIKPGDAPHGREDG